MQQKEPKSFEEAITRLEEIANILQKGDKGMEESMDLFEESCTLSNYCFEKLDNSKSRIVNLENEKRK